VTSTQGRPASSLDAVTELLGLRPAPARGAERDGSVRLGVVGSSRPRFLVPLDFPEASPEACLAYLGLRDAKTRITRGAVGLAFKARASRAVVRRELIADAGPGSLLAHLAELLADPEEEPGLAVAVGLGRIDEVWKPTLQVFRPDGTPAAFVKIGAGPVAAQLVTTEAATLEAWSSAPDPRLVVPELIAATTWEGVPIAVVAPLPLDVRRLPAGLPSAWPVRDLDGPVAHGSIADAPWWVGRRADLADDAFADGVLDRIQTRHSIGVRGGPKAWARWHGDWVPWNLARCHRGLVAWDWEYSEHGAPVGLDEVHGAYQQAHVVDGRGIAAALEAARAEAHRFATAAAADGSPAALRARAGTEASTPTRAATGAAAAWLADAHLAMLITRSAQLERLSGTRPAEQAELHAAVAAALEASE
jgi:hypothetical protein